ncbi:MAG: ParB/RepB/Spo0J family partition protein [Bacteroidota bacterium]|nr:ParB/RepB/Spo0J family partition protein [Bacteroidota bacterium]MDP4225030.1 ParB/RepB/Spo0J family partition protein [Bacteroidota bacterium]MDP4273757.1 ParB/RepB/Spo0J family partition protein [Bacteroidota bacterium]
MAKKNALGRGLGALIEEANTLTEETSVVNDVLNIREIAIDKIEANPFQPRKNFDQDALNELAASIQELGIIQPITVRKIEGGNYQLISGERRFRASGIAGLDKIPAYVLTVDDKSLLELALVENIQREDLNSIEVAISYQRLMEECSLTQERLSERVGKKRATISNYLRLLKLPAEIQLGIRENKLSMGHARALIGIDDPGIQLKAYHKVLEEGLSVRQVEGLVRHMSEEKEYRESLKNEEELNGKKVLSAIAPELLEVKKHLSDKLSTKIDLKQNEKGAGKIIISFKSTDDFSRILSLIDNAEI